MKKISTLSFVNSLLMAMICIVISAGVSAHPGHDHHHWLSGFYHVSAVLGFIIGVIALSYYFLSRTHKEARVHKVKRENLKEGR